MDDVQHAALDAADLVATIIDRRTGNQRAGLFGMEHDAAAGNVAVGRRGRFQPIEMVDLRTVTRTGVEFDVSAGDERAEAGNIGGGNARPDDPEPRPLAQQAFGVFLEFDANDHGFQIVGERHPFHGSDAHRTATHFRFPRGDAVSRLKSDFRDRATRTDISVNHPCADDQRDDRHDPDNVPTLGGAILWSSGWGRRWRRLRFAQGSVGVGGGIWMPSRSSRSQSSRGSKLIAANIVRTTTPANASAPGPGVMVM